MQGKQYIKLHNSIFKIHVAKCRNLKVNSVFLLTKRKKSAIILTGTCKIVKVGRENEKS